MPNESCINIKDTTAFMLLNIHLIFVQNCIYRENSTIATFARSRPWRALNATSCKKSQKKKKLPDASAHYMIL